MGLSPLRVALALLLWALLTAMLCGLIWAIAPGWSGIIVVTVLNLPPAGGTFLLALHLLGHFRREPKTLRYP